MPDQYDLIYRIFAIIFPIFSIVGLGYVYARLRRNTDMSSGNHLNMELFTPALIFDIMSQSNYALADFLPLALGGMVVVLGSGLLSLPVARLFGFQWKTFVPPMMFNNSGNMGVPLVILTFGEAALPAAIILLVLENFFHFLLGQQLITQRWSLRSVLKNPMIIATLAGVSFSLMDISIYDTLRLPIHMIGQIAIPLMLFSLGVRMLAIDFADWKIGLAGALVCPLSGLVMAFAFIYFIPLEGQQTSILMLFSALPPAVLNFLIADRFGQQPQQVASIVLIGNFVSILIIPTVLWAIL